MWKLIVYWIPLPVSTFQFSFIIFWEFKRRISCYTVEIYWNLLISPFLFRHIKIYFSTRTSFNRFKRERKKRARRKSKVYRKKIIKFIIFLCLILHNLLIVFFTSLNKHFKSLIENFGWIGTDRVLLCL